MAKELWVPEKSLSYLPDFPKELFIEEANSLYEELLNHRLEVVLIPAPMPKYPCHKIRFVQSRNPYWYHGLYYEHNRGKRKLFEKSLWRLVNRLDKDFNPKNNQYNYDTSFRQMIYSRFIEGYFERDGSRIFPRNDVRNFFGLEPVEIPDEEIILFLKEQ